MDTYVSQKFGSVWDPWAPVAETPEGKSPRDPIVSGRIQSQVTFSTGPASDWQPPVDIVECESEFVIRVALTVIKRDQVSVMLDGNILSICGKRERERNDRNQAYLDVERYYEAFRRSFTVPESTMREKVTADYKNGTLTVHLPKDPAGRIRAVEIDCEPL
jgi:HSP20 family protein